MIEAAQMAVDVWRHENIKELGPNKVTTYVKDIDNHIKSFVISRKGNPKAPKLFHKKTATLLKRGRLTDHFFRNGV